MGIEVKLELISKAHNPFKIDAQRYNLSLYPGTSEYFSTAKVPNELKFLTKKSSRMSASEVSNAALTTGIQGIVKSIAKYAGRRKTQKRRAEKPTVSITYKNR